MRRYATSIVLLAVLVLTAAQGGCGQPPGGPGGGDFGDAGFGGGDFSEGQPTERWEKVITDFAIFCDAVGIFDLTDCPPVPFEPWPNDEYPQFPWVQVAAGEYGDLEQNYFHNDLDPAAYQRFFDEMGIETQRVPDPLPTWPDDGLAGGDFGGPDLDFGGGDFGVDNAEESRRLYREHLDRLAEEARENARRVRGPGFYETTPPVSVDPELEFNTDRSSPDYYGCTDESDLTPCSARDGEGEGR